MRFSVLANPIVNEVLKIATNFQILVKTKTLHILCQNAFAILGQSCPALAKWIRGVELQIVRIFQLRQFRLPFGLIKLPGDMSLPKPLDEFPLGNLGQSSRDSE